MERFQVVKAEKLSDSGWRYFIHYPVSALVLEKSA